MLNKLKQGNSIALALIILAIVILGVAISAFILKPWESTPKETISVSAEGKTQVAPNIAKISATISTTNDDLDLARVQNEEKIDNAISAIKSVGVAEEDIKTQYLSGGPTYEILDIQDQSSSSFVPPRPPGQTKTNQISTTFEITVRDFDIADEVLAALTQNGATNLSGPRLTVDEDTIETAKSEARKDAVDNARKKASELAELSGKNLGDVVSINEGGGFRTPTPIFALSEADIAEKVNTIQPGQNDVSVTIQVDFELK